MQTRCGPLVQVLGSLILGVEQLWPGLCSNLIVTLQSQKASAGEIGLKTTHSCSVAEELKKSVPWLCHVSSKCPLEVILFVQYM